MSDADEVEAGMILASEESKKLKGLDPNHELLRLWDADDALWDEFQERFGKPGVTKETRGSYLPQAWFWAHYYLALKKVCEELSSKVVY